MVWTDNGQLLTFGGGGQGMYALGNSSSQQLLPPPEYISDQPEYQPAPRLVELQGLQVVDACAGISHAVVLTQDSLVLTFGLGMSGQLGHGGRETRLPPGAVSGMEGVRVASVAAGSDDTMLITETGQLKAFGCAVNLHTVGQGGNLDWRSAAADGLVPVTMGMQFF